MFIQEANAIASYHFNAAFCQLWDSIVMPSVRFQRDSSRAPFLNWSAILASSETAAKKVKIWWWRRLRENTNSTSSSFAHLAWCILEMYTAISIVAAFNWSLPKKNIQNFKFSILVMYSWDVIKHKLSLHFPQNPVRWAISLCVQTNGYVIKGNEAAVAGLLQDFEETPFSFSVTTWRQKRSSREFHRDWQHNVTFFHACWLSAQATRHFFSCVF